MKITILGSGGFTPTPLSNCHCKNCEEARTNHKLARTGFSLYIRDIDLLIDTPADSYHQIDKLGKFPKNVVYSHWHPDHTEGWRTLEFFNNTPDVYIPKESLILDRVPELEFLNSQNKIKIIDWETGNPIKSDNSQIIYFILSKEIPVYGFVFKDANEKTAVIIPDHSKFLLDIDLNLSPDLLIMNLGVQKTERNATTLSDNIKIIKKMKPKKVLFTHIESDFDLTEQQTKELETIHNATISNDNQVIEL